MVGVVIHYNRRNGDRVVKVYDGSDGYLRAGRDPGYRKWMGKINTDWETVIIGSDSLSTVEHTHSRYFAGHDRTKELAAQFE